MAKKTKESIEAAQLAAMLDRYVTTLTERIKMDAGNVTQHIERALLCARTAQAVLVMGGISDARHLCGFVQGILLCTGIHTWEYLATDDRRE